jgi:ABC-type branched-subunit amino acid transport system permease subunit
MNLGAALRRGLLVGIVALFLFLLGLPTLVGNIVRGWFNLASGAPGAWLLLCGLTLWTGVVTVRRVQSSPGPSSSAPTARRSWVTVLLNGLLAGLLPGLIVALYVFATGSLIAASAPVREWLVQITPEAVDLFTVGLPPLGAAAVAWAALSAAGVIGGVLAELGTRYHWGGFLRQKWQAGRTAVVTLPIVQKGAGFTYTRYILYGAGAVILLIAPLFLGQYWTYTLGLVGIYVILGVGLNVVVGLAGLLDLGYVAFFAIGAYTVALLTAPQPHGIMMSFWLALPIGVALAATAGVMLGIPVLRMRGDYLAIVTLGFGEIIRILSTSDVLTSFTGGPRGVRSVGSPTLFGFDLSNYFYHLILVGIVLVVFLSNRLQNSRVGRAWMAMRDDEDVAQAMGIYVLKYKLLAFAIGASFAGLGGVLFASRNLFTGPEDHTLLVSINVLCLVIVGGMGSIPGVVMGALVLKGLPEALRELKDYRMLAFGTLLVAMMILRPEGLWPSKRRRMELHEKDEQEPKTSTGAGP